MTGKGQGRSGAVCDNCSFVDSLLHAEQRDVHGRDEWRRVRVEGHVADTHGTERASGTNLQHLHDSQGRTHRHGCQGKTVRTIEMLFSCV